MRRLLRLIALLPFMSMLGVFLFTFLDSGELIIPNSYWMVAALVSLLAGVVDLSDIRDGVIGLLYSGLIAHYLLFVSYSLTGHFDSITNMIFLGYLIGVYMIAGFDILYARFLSMNKNSQVFSSIPPKL